LMPELFSSEDSDDMWPKDFIWCSMNSESSDLSNCKFHLTESATDP
jgi:hypothetical protein